MEKEKDMAIAINTLSLIKSKSRVKDVGEVFTPDFLVEQMLDLFPADAWKKNKMWLEPTCGNGQFIIGIINRKLTKGFTLLEALDTTFGLDIMEDNIYECHQRIYTEVVIPYFRRKKLTGKKMQKLRWMAACIVENNIVLTEDSLKENFNHRWRHFNNLPANEKEGLISEIQYALSMVDGDKKVNIRSKLYQKLKVFQGYDR